MYKFSYDEILVDGSAGQRGAEKQAFEHSIELLCRAEKHGTGSSEAIEAILAVNRVWSFLLEDLVNPANALSATLRASLISIGIWVLREAESISNGTSRNWRGIIEVTETIAEGLQ
jgi:flagellar protein FlaF